MKNNDLNYCDYFKAGGVCQYCCLSDDIKLKWRARHRVVTYGLYRLAVILGMLVGLYVGFVIGSKL